MASEDEMLVMNDKELLELAAKAAGIELAWMTGIGSIDFETGKNWNPLTDDGDVHPRNLYRRNDGLSKAYRSFYD